MGSTKKSVIVGIVLVAGLVSLVSLCRRASGPAALRPPARAWKCTKCQKVFELTYAQTERLRQPNREEIPDRPDPWSIPVVKPKGEPPSPIETVPCPACKGEAHRLISMRCTQCGNEFRHMEEVEAAGDDPKKPPAVKAPLCPECGSEKVVPR